MLSEQDSKEMRFTFLANPYKRKSHAYFYLNSIVLLKGLNIYPYFHVFQRDFH